KLFGSINNANLSEELAKAGVTIDTKYIKIPGNNIKSTGRYTAQVRLHRDVEYTYEFDVVSDAPPAPAAPKPEPYKVEAAAEESSEEAQKILSSINKITAFVLWVFLLLNYFIKKYV